MSTHNSPAAEKVKMEDNGLGTLSKSVIIQDAGNGFAVVGGVSPVVQIVQMVRRKKVTGSLNSLLRNTWMSAALIGVPVGGAVGYLRGEMDAGRNTHTTRQKTLNKATDYGIIGGVLGSLTLPTLVLRRARMVNGVLGGAAIGAAAGGLSGLSGIIGVKE